jgi:hypothetical protein
MLDGIDHTQVSSVKKGVEVIIGEYAGTPFNHQRVCRAISCANIPFC